MDSVNNSSENNFSKDIFLSKKIIFYIAGILGILLFFSFLIFSAPKNFPIGQTINIEAGTNLRALSKDLKNKKIIRSRVAFETLVIVYGGEKHIFPGDYFFEKKLSVFEVARRIAERERNLIPIKITIPEGFDNKQIADTFSFKLFSFNKNNFLTEAKDKEGYLFPDTYFFFNGVDEQEVLKYMNDNFNRKIVPLQKEISVSGKSQKDIIIMASLIEREAKGDVDRTIISGILWNRILKGMPLQIDAVPDTYKIKGLPNNPICNPGLKAIEAAMHPVTSSFLYYLHDKNGGVHYAKSFIEHKQNKLKYLK